MEQDLLVWYKMIFSEYDAFLLFVAFILPPMAVFLRKGVGFYFWLNVVLTIFGWMPGVINALATLIRFRDEKQEGLHVVGGSKVVKRREIRVGE